MEHAEYLEEYGNEFNRSYIESALDDLTHSDEWESVQPASVNDLSDLAFARMLNDCQSFQHAASKWFRSREADAGHDFWLTRNGHGGGFWDGDWPEPDATILTVASKACGEFDLTVGDDGKIHN